MQYKDRIYGEFEPEDVVILELINSPSLQRLKRIDQAGYNSFWMSESEAQKCGHSRFSHSVGVYLLLKKYDATLAEQIAGLIHDVSHTAFSHCIDYVLNVGNEHKQDYQDNTFEAFVKKSEIPAILEKYAFDPEYILDDKNFPLKEKNLPDLCADRVDYVLRDASIFADLGSEDVNYFLNNLLAENGNWFFKDFASARKFADLFLEMNNKFYAGLYSATMFRSVGDFVKYSLEKGYILQEDLKTDDSSVIEKAKGYINSDEKLKLLFDRMNNKIPFSNNPEIYDAEVLCKSRAVDPLFLDGNKLVRVSEAEPSWKEVVMNELKPKKYFVKFER